MLCGKLMFFVAVLIVMVAARPDEYDDSHCDYTYECRYRMKLWPYYCLRWKYVKSTCRGPEGGVQPDHSIHLTDSELVEIREHNHVDEGQELVTEEVIQAVNALHTIDDTQATVPPDSSAVTINVISVPVICKPGEAPDQFGKCRALW